MLRGLTFCGTTRISVALSLSASPNSVVRCCASSTDNNNSRRRDEAADAKRPNDDAAGAAQAQRAKQVQDLRATSKTLFRRGLHSNLLSEHPMTMRQQKQELERRQEELAKLARTRKAAEAAKAQEGGSPATGNVAESQAGDIDLEKLTPDEIAQERVKVQRALEASKRAQAKYQDYYLAMGFCGSGFLLGHYVAHSIYGGETRLTYDPAEGFIDAIMEQRERLDALEGALAQQIMSDVQCRRQAANDVSQPWWKLWGRKQQQQQSASSGSAGDTGVPTRGSLLGDVAGVNGGVTVASDQV